MSVDFSPAPAAVTVTQTVYAAPVPRKSVLKEGKLTANGTEQLVVEAPGILNLEGYIDLSPMTAGDTVVLMRYVKIEEGGDYRLHASETYSGVQAHPLIRFPFMASYYGIKVTLQQTAGALKSFPYQFIKEA